MGYPADKGVWATKGPRKDHSEAGDEGVESWESSEFVGMVRDALLHLYDTPYLQTHQLAQRIGASGSQNPSVRGGRLFQVLVSAIEALRPSPGTPTDSRGRRAYRLLELRYIEGHSAESTAAELAISGTQYKRDSTRSLEAVASVLRDRFPLLSPPFEAARVERSREALAFAEAGELASHSSPCQIDLGQTLCELVDLVRPEAERSGAELCLLAPEETAPIHGDRVVLRQVILGLLGTALSVASNGRVEVVASSTRQVAAVEVSATPGSDKPKGERLEGIELDITRRLVGLLGGTLASGRSSDDHRWRAVLELPAVPRLLVLVVDNDADFIRLVGRYLAAEDADVIGASDVQSAEAVALAREPNVVLLDVMLPGRDGWDCLLALRSHPETRQIPVIICSVLYEPQVARALGVAGYLAKPVSRADLIRVLQPYRADWTAQQTAC
jgi:CheY-like chemotaxis protein